MTILTELAVHYFAHYSIEAVHKLFGQAFKLKPELEGKLDSIKTTSDLEAFFKEAVGVIDAAASDGKIEVNETLLSAVRGIRFDHQNGTVTIENSTLKADILHTGGSQGAKGTTTISATNMHSKGTSIQVGKGASITITGGASITQT